MRRTIRRIFLLALILSAAPRHARSAVTGFAENELLVATHNYSQMGAEVPSWIDVVDSSGTTRGFLNMDTWGPLRLAYSPVDSYVYGITGSGLYRQRLGEVPRLIGHTRGTRWNAIGGTGISVDPHGNIWAIYAAQLDEISPAGTILREIPLPTLFLGAQGLEYLDECHMATLLESPYPPRLRLAIFDTCDLSYTVRQLDGLARAGELRLRASGDILIAGGAAIVRVLPDGTTSALVRDGNQWTSLCVFPDGSFWAYGCGPSAAGVYKFSRDGIRAVGDIYATSAGAVGDVDILTPAEFVNAAVVGKVPAISTIGFIVLTLALGIAGALRVMHR